MTTMKASGRSGIQTRRSTSKNKDSGSPTAAASAKTSTRAISIPGSRALKSVSDSRLLSRTRKLSERERETVLSILVHLNEIDRRRLYLSMGYSSLFKLCVKELKYSESVAGRRIAVARCIKRFPRAYRALASGKVNLTNLGLIEGIMTEENEKELLRSIIGASQRDVRALVSRHDPRTVIRDRIRPVHVRTEIRLPAAGSVEGAENPDNTDNSKKETAKSLDRRAATTPIDGSGKSPNSPDAINSPCSVDMFSGSGPAAATESGSEAAASGDRVSCGEMTVMVIEEMFELKFGASQEFVDKIAQMKSLLSTKYHRDIELAELFSIVMDEYIERHSPEGRIRRKERREQRKASQKTAAKKVVETSKKPSKNSKSDIKEVSRYILRRVRDEVHARDKGRCTYVSPGGRRCGAKSDLQVDHIVPFARGGDNSPSNLRLLCGKHNRLEAERAYGKKHMERHVRKHGEKRVGKHGEQHIKEPGQRYFYA